MPDKSISSCRLVAPAVLVVLLLIAAAGQAAEFTREFNFAGEELRLVNLIGEVRVEPSSSRDFQVTVEVRGEDATQELLEFMVVEGHEAELVIKFPVDEHRDYVYRALDRNNECVIHFQQDSEGSWLKKIFSDLGSRKIKVRGSGRGLELWADVTVRMPRGAAFELRNGVGDIKAGGIEGDLNLDSHAGTVQVDDVTGDVLADTGSGEVTVVAVQGEVAVDTGSGRVRVSDCRGDKVYVDTGSGSVKIRDVVCDELEVDTGSGGVEARAVTSEEILIDTGSGGVHLQLDSLTEGEVEVDTGSGGVELVLPTDVSAELTADTGSGRIVSELEGATVNGSSSDELYLEIGGGRARIKLDTGSGGITIRQE